VSDNDTLRYLLFVSRFVLSGLVARSKSISRIVWADLRRPWGFLAKVSLLGFAVSLGTYKLWSGSELYRDPRLDTVLVLVGVILQLSTIAAILAFFPKGRSKTVPLLILMAALSLGWHELGLALGFMIWYPFIILGWIAGLLRG
jgi:hypothetical protein